ncbi:MAG: hypothetical protein ACMZ64_06440 [Oleiphilus sp.]
MRNKPKRLTKQNFLVVFLLLSPVSHSDTTEHTLSDPLMTQRIQNVLESIPSLIEKIITTPIGHESLQNLAHALKELKIHLVAAMNNQGFHLGFSSRDGD